MKTRGNTLVERCEPIFQYICSLSLHETLEPGSRPHIEVIRERILRLFDQLERELRQVPGGSEHFHAIKRPLMYFVDYHMIGLDRGWTWLATGEGQISPGTHFFELLDEQMANKSQEGDERLGVFYQCLALGFTGDLEGDPDRLDQLMRDLYHRSSTLDERIDVREHKLIPEAYDSTVSRPFAVNPGRRLVGLLILLIGSVLLVLMLNATAFFMATGEIRKNIQTLTSGHGKVVEKNSSLIESEGVQK